MNRLSVTAMLAATVASLTLAGSVGCVSHNVRVICAADPAERIGIARFQIGSDRVTVFGESEGVGPVDADGNVVEQLSVESGEKFEVRRFNLVEMWTLTEIGGGHAAFQVDGRIYGCTDAFAILFGIPSYRYRDVVIVCACCQ